MQHLSLQTAIAQRIAETTTQEMYQTLTADGYAIPFSFESATPSQLAQIRNEYTEWFHYNVQS